MVRAGLFPRRSEISVDLGLVMIPAIRAAVSIGNTCEYIICRSQVAAIAVAFGIAEEIVLGATLIVVSGDLKR